MATLGEFLAPGYPSMLNFDIPILGNLCTQRILSQDKAMSFDKPSGVAVTTASLLCVYTSNDVYIEPLLQDDLSCQELEIKSMLAVRTSYKGKPNGMICLHQCDNNREWTSEEIELLESIATHLGIALAQAKLLEEEKGAYAKLDRQNFKLQQETRDRLLVEAARKTSESKYRHLVETSQDLIWSIDIDGLITFINPVVKQSYGYEVQEIIGRAFTNFILPAQIPNLKAAFQRVLKGEPIFQYETSCITKDGSTLYLMVNAIALRNEEGLVIGVTGTASNITEHKHVKQALQESTIKLRNHNLVLTQLAKNPALYQGNLKAALNQITEAAAKNIGVERASIWLYDEIGINLQCLDLFEQSRNQHSEGFSLLAADYPAYFQALQQEQLLAVEDAYTDRRTKEFSESYLTPLGITSLLDAPIRLGGKTVGVLCLEAVGVTHNWTLEDQNFARSSGNLISLVLEIRSRQRAEASRRVSEEKLASAFRSSPDPISLSTFPETCYTEVNDSFCRFFGYSRSQVIGRTHKELDIWVNREQCAVLNPAPPTNKSYSQP